MNALRIHKSHKVTLKITKNENSRIFSNFKIVKVRYFSIFTILNIHIFDLHLQYFPHVYADGTLQMHSPDGTQHINRVIEKLPSWLCSFLYHHQCHRTPSGIALICKGSRHFLPTVPPRTLALIASPGLYVNVNNLLMISI